MPEVKNLDGVLVWHRGHQVLHIEEWGENSLRVRATLWGQLRDDPVQALLEPSGPSKSVISIDKNSAKISNGSISCELNTETGDLAFFRNGALLTREKSSYVIEEQSPARRIRHAEGELLDVTMEFEAYQNEKFFGLGQNPNGRLDQKGNKIEFRQRNGIVSIPFLVSNRGYGIFWNNPGLGEVSMGSARTIWQASACHQLDYWITAGSNLKEIVERYTVQTGLSPAMPEWATGFWQCRLRYQSQDELLEVARTHKAKNYPMSVIVIDYFAWSKQGEWQFDAKKWPDPSAMVAELESLGIKAMVSIWPTVNPKAKTFNEINDKGYLIRARSGHPLVLRFVDTEEDGPAHVSYYDATNPEARAYIWQKCKEGYFEHGIKSWWLDACEPEMYPDSQENTLYHIGAGSAVTNAYPFFNSKAFYEGMRAEGEEEIVLLTRSAWAGSQRFGSLVWSGDVHSEFTSLANQIRLGMNMAMSGISWWTTDIGGFRYGDARSAEFRELLVRWFQFGVFSPVCRLHGDRVLPEPAPGEVAAENASMQGAPNEIWSFGEDVEKLLADLLLVREKLRPYVSGQMENYQKYGTPFLRPLSLDFPGDPAAWEVEDAYMFGETYYVAPVVKYNARARRVYFPENSSWKCFWTGKTYAGGQSVDVCAPLEQIPVFERCYPV